MKRFATLFACLFSMALLLAACSSSSESNLDKINGKWECDADATMKLAGKAMEPAAMQVLQPLFKSLSLDIDSKAKKMSFAFAQQKIDGTFTVESEKDNSIVLIDSEKKKVTFTLGKDDLLTMQVEGQPQAMVLKRAAK